MTTYDVSRLVPFSSSDTWTVLADVRHFEREDPFHHELRFEGPQRSGVGTSFSVRHSYWPIFPLPPDRVVCSVVRWEPERRLTLLEKNRFRILNHTQEFVLEPCIEGTWVHYRIRYRGVPWYLPLQRVWADWRVHARMREKLHELERDLRAKGS